MDSLEPPYIVSDIEATAAQGLLLLQPQVPVHRELGPWNGEGGLEKRHALHHERGHPLKSLEGETVSGRSEGSGSSALAPLPVCGGSLLVPPTPGWPCRKLSPNPLSYR